MNAVTNVNNALPAHLQNQQKSTSVGNVDRKKLIIPRVKLLQGVSPEIEQYNNAKPGQFWHNMAEQLIGSEIPIVPIKMKRTYVLWAPRDDDRNVLARADDAIHWDQPAGMEFTVKLKNVPDPVTYKLGNTVDERTEPGKPALSEFGSGIPGDPKSAPAAAETFTWMFLSPAFPDLGPFIVINTRSSAKPANLLVSKIEQRPVDHYAQKYIMKVVAEVRDGDRFYNYAYTADGYADEADYNKAKEMFAYYSENDYAASDEKDDAGGDAGGTPGRASKEPAKPSANRKF